MKRENKIIRRYGGYMMIECLLAMVLAVCTGILILASAHVFGQMGRRFIQEELPGVQAIKQ